MSKDILREMVLAIGRLRRESMDHDRIEERAARLEEHLVELEFLATQAIPDVVEPAFEATPLGPAKPAAASAGVVGPARGVAPTPLAGENQQTPKTLMAAVRLMRARQLSPVELIEQHLARIREAEELNAFIAVFEEQARQEAQAADKALAADSAGLLAGIPLAVKDLMQMKGYAMTGGSRVLDESPSSIDADVVARLRAAGAVIIGAANLHELAYGVTSENPHYGSVKNPRQPDHMAGGSSGGSAAAVAAHLALGAAAPIPGAPSASPRPPAAW